MSLSRAGHTVQHSHRLQVPAGAEVHAAAIQDALHDCNEGGGDGGAGLAETVAALLQAL